MLEGKCVSFGHENSLLWLYNTHRKWGCGIHLCAKDLPKLLAEVKFTMKEFVIQL